MQMQHIRNYKTIENAIREATLAAIGPYDVTARDKLLSELALLRRKAAALD
jgi:hypothetical protein